MQNKLYNEKSANNHFNLKYKRKKRKKARTFILFFFSIYIFPQKFFCFLFAWNAFLTNKKKDEIFFLFTFPKQISKTFGFFIIKCPLDYFCYSSKENCYVFVVCALLDHRIWCFFLNLRKKKCVIATTFTRQLIQLTQKMLCYWWLNSNCCHIYTSTLWEGDSSKYNIKQLPTHHHSQRKQKGDIHHHRMNEKYNTTNERTNERANE